MKIQPPNYTQAPNQLFDEWLPLLGCAELKVLMVIIRKTFGWHKIRDRISLTQLQEITGLERRHVSKAIKSLIQKNLISKFVCGENGTQETFYELVLIDDSNNLDQCPKDTRTSVLKTPTKERTKETISPIVPKGDPPFRKSKREEKQEVAPSVFLTPTQKRSISEKVNGSEDVEKLCYKRFSEWKIGKEIVGGKNDYLSITKWVIDAVLKDISSGKTATNSDEHMKFLEKIKEKVQNPSKLNFFVGYNYIEFHNGMNVEKITIGESAFKERIENELRKRGIRLD